MLLASMRLVLKSFCVQLVLAEVSSSADNFVYSSYYICYSGGGCAATKSFIG
jgi:hypothetical protein